MNLIYHHISIKTGNGIAQRRFEVRFCTHSLSRRSQRLFRGQCRIQRLEKQVSSVRAGPSSSCPSLFYGMSPIFRIRQPIVSQWLFDPRKESPQKNGPRERIPTKTSDRREECSQKVAHIQFNFVASSYLHWSTKTQTDNWGTQIRDEFEIVFFRIPLILFRITNLASRLWILLLFDWFTDLN
jgi:hypothetical protein